MIAAFYFLTHVSIVTTRAATNWYFLGGQNDATCWCT